MKKANHKFLFTLFSLLFSLALQAGDIRGIITDKQNGDPLTGATFQIVGTTLGAVADMDGNFTLTGISNGTYRAEVKYIGYRTLLIEDIRVSSTPVELNIELEMDAHTLGDVTVVAQVKRSTDLAMNTAQRTSLVVQSGVSAQQISRTQDKDASEVIRRVPGISIIDDKFVIVRGLSQRYNNVWINNSAVPSSEADSRAFSFDIIPSSQLDNMVIVKSAAPEYPADFTGGFILINTKDMPSENSLQISVGTSLNDETHFKDFLYNKGSKTDFLGFDNGLRSLDGGIHRVMNKFSGDDDAIDLLNNHLNNDWKVRSRKPIGDLKFNLAFNRRWDTESGRRFALLAAVNYSNAYKTFLDMENSLFGSYDHTHNHSVYLRKSTDNQYNHDVRIGAMVNFTFQPRDSRHRYEFKNIFNQLGKSRYTNRVGTDAQSNNEESMEYYYSSRSAYNGQFTGKYTLDQGRLDWSAGYAYANRNLPDRRRIVLNDILETDKIGWTTANDISREFTKLDEHIFSGNVNYQHDFQWGEFTPTLKTGAYGEYRARAYNTRLFYYNWNYYSNTLPSGFRYMDITNELLVNENYGLDKLHLFEEVNYLNNYRGNNTHAAGYVAAHLPFRQLILYAGLRYEYTKMELIQNAKRYEKSELSSFFTYHDLFPSVNMTYLLTGKQQIRLSYGKTVNRPEFRELATSVFYDFDLASDVMGNSQLKPAYIHNIDLRYEYYPSGGEQVSVALFYKNFTDPIEWTYSVAGGTNLVYSYMNAEGANNYGVELDIRKNLDFIGMRAFGFSFNGAFIKSKVKFEEGSKEQDRPMQGQSPYLINTGIFYQGSENGWNAAVLYNRIGKRIIGVGRSVGTTGGEDSSNIPNSYEMPRNAIDLSIGKKLGHWELKLSVRDLLAERVYFKQMAEIYSGEKKTHIEEITKTYKPGRSFGLTVNYNF